MLRSSPSHCSLSGRRRLCHQRYHGIRGVGLPNSIGVAARGWSSLAATSSSCVEAPQPSTTTTNNNPTTASENATVSSTTTPHHTSSSSSAHRMGRLVLDALLRSQSQVLMVPPTITSTTTTCTTRTSTNNKSASWFPAPHPLLLLSSSSSSSSSLVPVLLGPHELASLPPQEKEDPASPNSIGWTTTTTQKDHQDSIQWTTASSTSRAASLVEDEEETPPIKEEKEEDPWTTQSLTPAPPTPPNDNQNHNNNNDDDKKNPSPTKSATSTTTPTESSSIQSRLVTEFQRALFTRQVEAAIAVLDQAAKWQNRSSRRTTNTTDLEHNHHHTGPESSSSSSSSPPLPLSDVHKLFYLCLDQGKALAAHHVLQNYIYWDRQRQAHSSQKQQKQHGATAFPNDNQEDDASPLGLPIVGKPPQPPSFQPSLDENEEFLLKDERDAMLQQQERQDDPTASLPMWGDAPSYEACTNNNNHYPLEPYRLEYRQWIAALEHLTFTNNNHTHNPNQQQAYGTVGRVQNRTRGDKMIRRILSDMETGMSPESQAYLLPKFLVSLLTQRGFPQTAESLAPVVYQTMVHRQYRQVTTQGSYLEHLLLQISYNRRHHLPWHDVIHRMVFEVHHTPHKNPHCIVQCLEMGHPYRDITSTHSILQALQQLLLQERQEQERISHQDPPTNGKDHNNNKKKASVYRVDMATLELIAAAAAQAGAFETVLLVWEIVELLPNTTPTVALYEHSVLAFCQRGPDQYSHMWAVLQEWHDRVASVQQHQHSWNNSMEFVEPPGRALVRSLSTRFRKSYRHSQAAYHTLKETVEAMERDIEPFHGTSDMSSGNTTWETNSHSFSSPPQQCQKHVSIAAFNAVLSGFAERALVEDTRLVMDLLNQHMETTGGRHVSPLRPTADTFSFLLEGLGKYLRLCQDQEKEYRNPTNTTITAGGRPVSTSLFQSQLRLAGRRHLPRRVTPELIQGLLSTADSYLSEMEDDWKIAPTNHVIREYVELLVMAGDVDTANEMVLQALEQQPTGSDLVSSKTLYRLAVANARVGNMTVANQLAHAGCDKPIDFEWSLAPLSSLSSSSSTTTTTTASPSSSTWTTKVLGAAAAAAATAAATGMVVAHQHFHNDNDNDNNHNHNDEPRNGSIQNKEDSTESSSSSSSFPSWGQGY